ncbi:MAG TPA: hypothetical protein DEA22_02145 [Blastocatellia bacterium]|nr:hypothetical protein [Blastocatellia bacterium]
MKNAKVILVVLALIVGVSLSCKFLKDKTPKSVNDTRQIDFTTPADGLDVKVDLDKKQTSSAKIDKSGGSISLTAADGSKFTLEVPADALDAETTITLTAVKTVDGAPLDNKTPTAVQLEPSGLKLKQVAALTITPAKEIPVKEQIVFGYEGNGKDYHLAPVDPKSKVIKVKLLGFSGAGVGTGSDSAWAAHQIIEASNASTRLLQKFGEATQAARREILVEGDESGSSEDLFKSFLDAFMEQVVMKEIAAAELDCKHAEKALHDLIFHERLTQLVGLADSGKGSPGFIEKTNKLLDIGHKCKKSYRVNGSSNNVSFTGEICNINKPFTIDAKYPGGTAKTTFFPDVEGEGQTTVTGSGGGCTHSGGGDYTVVLKDDGSGTLTWTTTDTISCPGFSNSRTATFSLPLQPAPDLSCP